MMGNVNQTTPDGSLRFTYDDHYTWTDPYNGQTYSVPRPTATQTLSPQGQAISDANGVTRLNMANMGAEQSAELRSMLSTPFDLSGAPAAGTAGNYTQFKDGPKLATAFGDAGDITDTYGTDFSEDRQRVEDALFERLEGRMGDDRRALDTRLANQGIRAGSDTYSRAQGDFDQSLQEARTSAILGAGQEQSRLANLERDRAMFENAAQGQEYGQLFGRANFANAGEQAMYDNYFRANAGNNDIASRTFNEMNTLRGDYMTEQYAQRNQGINELIGLMSGSQVQNPNFINAQQQAIPHTDTAGLINTHYDQQVAKAMAEYQASSGMFGGLMGGIGALGAAFG